VNRPPVRSRSSSKRTGTLAPGADQGADQGTVAPIVLSQYPGDPRLECIRDRKLGFHTEDLGRNGECH